MQIFSIISDLQSFLSTHNSEKKNINFVPTMGALHNGHASLIKEAKKNDGFTVVSIFVNPTQFNNPSDFEKYPITIESDIELLESLGTDVLFLPSVDEIYSKDYVTPELELGLLDSVMEGKLRPGHFKGVVQVVYRLFDIIKPTNAYFGLKDFQQVSVIKHMVEKLNLNVNIIPMPTIRENSGLAMSSRNLRLNELEKNEAENIYKIMSYAKDFSNTHTPIETKKFIIEEFKKTNLELEYAEIVNPKTLESLANEWIESATLCVVAYAGEVRLIDNFQLKN